jgi:predicted acylesterase/phospholipase RssA/CRP-like cAMP-binding protein
MNGRPSTGVASASSKVEDLEKATADAKAVALSAGEVLSLGSDSEDVLFVVASGTIQVGEANSDKQLKPLVAGDIFTKLALSSYAGAEAIRAEQAAELICVPMAALDFTPSARQSVLDKVTKCLLRIQVSGADIFRELDESALSYMADHSEFVWVKRGEIIIREGDKTDCVYIIVSGSLEVFKGRADADRCTVDILRAGATVGELAVLLNEPRTASVRAWRDSLLIKVSDRCVEQVLHQNAAVTFRLARTLGDRLKRTTNHATRTAAVKTIALVPFCSAAIFEQFSSRLQLAFQKSGARTSLLSPSALPAEGATVFGPEWIEAREAACDYLLLKCQQNSPRWTESSIEYADLVLFACAPGEQQAPPDLQQPELSWARSCAVRSEVVLLRESDRPPQGTARWLAAFSTHHHVALDADADCERVVRRICGDALGVVLSGGGARGLAHIGVIRAIREKGLPIDMIGGTSMGAIIAAQYARGYDVEQMLAITRKAYLGRSAESDFTIPFVSLRTGRSTIQQLVRMFGQDRIEDLPIGYFCASSNLSRAGVVIHDSGPLWMAARVSCSVPGLLPPIPFQGDVLVDGGFLDNLPVDAMRKRLNGSVIAADVSVEVDLSVNRELSSETSWSGVSQLLRKLTRRPALPSMVDILMRTVEIGSVRDSRDGGIPAELYLKVPVGNTPMTRFNEMDRLVAIGYEYAMQKLENWQPHKFVM